MKSLSSVACILAAFFAISASAAPQSSALHTLDRLTRPQLASERKTSHDKVSGWLRAAQRGLPSAGPLVPADPPRSPEGDLLVYVDCEKWGAEQIEALQQAGLTVDGVDSTLGRVRGSIDDAGLDGLAEFSWVRAVRPVDPSVVRVGRATTEGDSAGEADLLRVQGLDGSGVAGPAAAAQPR